MELYDEFLVLIGFPSREYFNKVLEKLPKIKKFDPHITYDNTFESLENVLFQYGVLEGTEAIVGCVDTSKKTVDLSYCDDDKELEKINNTLNESGWTINNYEIFKKDLILVKRDSLIDIISDKATLTQLENFVNQLEND